MKKLIISSLLSLFVCASYAQTTQKIGVLLEAVQVPLVMNGKQVGSSAAAAGTKVQVVSEAVGKILVAVSGGQVWVAPEKVDVQEALATPVVAAVTTTPSAAGPAAKADMTAAARVKTPGASRFAGKRILFIIFGGNNQANRMLMSNFKEAGATVTVAGETGHAITDETRNEDAATGTMVGAFVVPRCNWRPDIRYGSEGESDRPDWNAIPKWNNSMVKNFDAFIIPHFQSVLRAFPIKDIWNSGKVVVCGEMEPKYAEELVATGAIKSSTARQQIIRRPYSFTGQGSKLYYNIYCGSSGKNVKKGTDDESTKIFIDSKLLPAISAALK